MNRTFYIIKPDAIFNKFTGNIIFDICNNGFEIIAIKKTKMSKNLAEMFYNIHKEKCFFKELIEFISSGPIIVGILEKDNAITEFRNLIGDTNPLNAKSNTIRKKYATSITKNAIHGSDSPSNFLFESKCFFSELEIVS